VAFEVREGEGEALPFGIILCTGTSAGQIKTLELDAAGIHVAEYLAVLPPGELLHRKLHDAIAAARLRFQSKEAGPTSRHMQSISRHYNFIARLRRESCGELIQIDGSVPAIAFIVRDFL